MPDRPEGSDAPDEANALADRRRDPRMASLVRANLRALGADLATAVAASNHDHWAATLEAVRRIQGRAVLTRQALERMLGLDAITYLPPLVRTLQEVRRVISPGEVDSLPPDALRARMHAVLQALDLELKTLLSPPDEL
jgi:hypothetical protein